MKFLSVLMAISALAMLSGCAGFVRAPVVPPQGLAFTSTTAPMDVDYDTTDLGTKIGQSESHNVLGLIAWGDASSETAARTAGINEIRHADYEMFNLLGIYSKFTTIVYGE